MEEMRESDTVEQSGQERNKPASARSSGDGPRNLSYVLIAWFPVFVAFVLIPFAVYLPNQEEFSGNLFGPAVCVLAAVLAFPALLLLLLLGRPIRERIACMLFFLGIYLILKDVLAPIQIGPLTAGPLHVNPSEPPFLTIVELVLIIATLWAGIRMPPGWAARIGAPFVIILVVVQGFYFITNIRPNVILKWRQYTLYQKKTGPSDVEKPAHTGNVYQICIDAYSSLVFPDAVKALDAADAFKGFTFFKNNRSNYVFTCGSAPSYFTGTFFPGGSVTKWDDNRTNSGMIETLHDHGYSVSMYVPDSGYFHESGSHNVQLLDLIRGSDKPASYFGPEDFGDLCLLRIVPNWCRQELYSNGRGLLNRLFAAPHQGDDATGREDTTTGSYPTHFGLLAKALLTEERQRPAKGQYVYGHLQITHAPIGFRNQDCSLNREGQATYFDHAVCATRFMVRFISELKKLGRYDDSTIIIQSDHGESSVGSPGEVRKTVPSGVAARIRELAMLDAHQLIPRTHALLLVKLPGQTRAPLRISESPTALVDIPATVYAALGINHPTEQGRPVFEIKESEQREIHMFAGFYREGVVGQLTKIAYPNGKLCHFSFTRGRGWKLYPDITFTRD